MAYIDILIPVAIGLLLALRPRSFVKPDSDSAKDPAKLRRLRLIGVALLGVAALYAVIRLLSSR